MVVSFITCMSIQKKKKIVSSILALAPKPTFEYSTSVMTVVQTVAPPHPRKDICLRFSSRDGFTLNRTQTALLPNSKLCAPHPRKDICLRFSSRDGFTLNRTQKALLSNSKLCAFAVMLLR
jgi:hypothetical protein